MRAILIWIGLMAWLSAHAQLLTPPVRPEVRNAVTLVSSWTEVSSPPGNVGVGSAVAGTISGWATPVGAPYEFRRVSFPLTASVPGYVPAIVRVRVREGDSTGTVVGDKTQAVALSLGVTKTVSIDLPSVVTNAARRNLWIEIITDGRIDEWRILETPFASPTARYWTDANPTSPGTSLVAASQRNYPITFLAEATTATTPTLSSLMVSLVEDSTVMSRIVNLTRGVVPSTIIGTKSYSAMAVSSTFSGWAQGLPPIASTNAFTAISFYLYPFDSAARPSQVRVRIRSMPSDVAQWTNNPSTFGIVADTIQSVAPAAGVYTRVTARFARPIYGTNLFVEYLTNGKEGGMFATSAGVTNLIPNPPGRWYTTSGSVVSATWVKSVTAAAFYCELGVESSEVAGYDVTDEFKAKLGSVPSTETVTLQMPETIWALEGREMNVYARNVIRSSADPSTMQVDFASTKGAQWGAFGGFWRYTPTSGDAGTTSLTLTIRDQESGSTLASATASLVTRALSYPATPVTRRLHCIGDSTLGGSGAAVLAELVNLFVSDTQYTLNLTGSNDGTVTDSTATSRTVRCDAISGWRVDQFATNSSTAWTEIGGTARTGSPFVFGGVFSYATFLATNSITMASNDVVLFHLGINDVFNYYDDAELATKLEDMASRLETMIAGVQAAVPGVRVCVATTIPPNDSQDGFGADYGAGQTQRRYRRNRDLWVERILSQFGGRTGSRIYVLGYGATLDTVNNFAGSDAAVNARNSTTYFKASAGSGVHPAPAGYYQLADTIRAFLKGIE